MTHNLFLNHHLPLAFSSLILIYLLIQRHPQPDFNNITIFIFSDNSLKSWNKYLIENNFLRLLLFLLFHLIFSLFHLRNYYTMIKLISALLNLSLSIISLFDLIWFLFYLYLFVWHLQLLYL